MQRNWIIDSEGKKVNGRREKLREVRLDIDKQGLIINNFTHTWINAHFKIKVAEFT